MAKFKEKLKARELRKRGESIKVIAQRLGVSVGSVSRWCRDIELSQEQLRALEQRSKDPFYGKRMQYLIRIKKEKDRKIKRLKNEGIKEVGLISKRELFLTGVALYWAEGYKKDTRVGLGSSDVMMIKFFIRWLKDCFGYSLEDLSFRVTVNIEHKHRVDDIQNYWARKLGVSRNKFGKPFFQKTKWKKVYENPENYFGVMRVRVRKSTDFLRKIYGYIEGLRLQVS